jgi:dihydrofolate reductase
MPKKIIATQYISLDGVIEDPVGMENSGLGDWTGPFTRGPEGDRFKHEELFACETVLLGRITYDSFAAVWPTVKDEAGFADRINAMPKYVASNTLARAEWTNTTVLSGDAVAAVRALKDGAGGDILVYGSATLLHHLIGHGLVDAYNLMIYPIVLGRGKRLFPEGHRETLVTSAARTLGSGIVLLQLTRAAGAA